VKHSGLEEFFLALFFVIFLAIERRIVIDRGAERSDWCFNEFAVFGLEKDDRVFDCLFHIQLVGLNFFSAICLILEVLLDIRQAHHIVIKKHCNRIRTNNIKLFATLLEQADGTCADIDSGEREFFIERESIKPSSDVIEIDGFLFHDL